MQVIQFFLFKKSNSDTRIHFCSKEFNHGNNKLSVINFEILKCGVQGEREASRESPRRQPAALITPASQVILGRQEEAGYQEESGSPDQERSYSESEEEKPASTPSETGTYTVDKEEEEEESPTDSPGYQVSAGSDFD